MATTSDVRFEPTIVIDAPIENDNPRSLFQLTFLRFLHNRAAVGGVIFLILMALAAIFAPILIHETATVHPATDTHIEIALQGPSFAHILGTDDVGRDEFARLLYGARVSLLIGVVSMLVSMTLGTTIGAVAGYFGGWIDTIFMRITDAFLAVPLYLILFVVSAFFVAGGSGSITKIILLLGFFSWANTARIVRGEYLALRERDFVLAAHALGVGNMRVILRHILPNVVGPITVNATLLIGGNIITESTLSFFGFGIQPPDASWGNMLAASQSYFTIDSVLTLAPGIALLLTVLSFNLMGDGLSEALNPHTNDR
jgi:peptide/nickel transport system permease protein